VTNAVSALLMFPGPDQVADSPSLFEVLVMMLAKAMPVKTIAGYVGECQSALKNEPPSASKIDPPQAVFFSC
jgi:hypothetical protein